VPSTTVALLIRISNIFDQSGFSPAAGKKTAGLIKKETEEFTAEFAENAEKNFLDNLSVLSDLCGEILFEGTGLYDVSYKVSGVRTEMLGGTKT
jgi:hypothetical protein